MTKKKFTIENILKVIFLFVAIFLAISTCVKLFEETDNFSKQNEELMIIQKSIILDNYNNKLILGYPNIKIDNKYQITANYDNTNNQWIINIKSQKNFLEIQEYTKCLDASGEYTGYFKYLTQKEYFDDVAIKISFILIFLIFGYYLTWKITTTIILIIKIRKK